jgi:hypothetical protein
MIDDSSELGARVARHLREETIVWLTTVTWERAGMTAESFSERFSVPVRIRLAAVPGF